MHDDEVLLTDMTRREALKKIGRFGIYVPATMAVLTAAPRAFAQSGDPASLTGRITRCGTIIMLADATVTVQSNPERSGTTNSSGEYTVTGIPAGDWDVEASKAGYHSYTVPQVHFHAGDEEWLDICLTPE
jgi:hypothetical protein